MIQDILTYLVLIGAVVIAVYRILIRYIKKRKIAPSCTDVSCTGCTIKSVCKE